MTGGGTRAAPLEWFEWARLPGLDAMDRERAASRALENANTLLLPLIRAVRRFNLSCRRRSHESCMAIRMLQTGDRRIHVAVIDIPGSVPLVVAVYSSVQTSRPVSPAQLAKRLNRLSSIVSKLRGRLFNAADILYFYLSPVRLTRTAYRLARRNGVHVALNASKALSMLRRYIGKRVTRLRDKLQGRRVWGRVQALYDALQLLYNTVSDEPVIIKQELSDMKGP